METLLWVHGEKTQHHKVWNVLAELVAIDMLLLPLPLVTNSRAISVHPREKFHGCIIMCTVLVKIVLHNTYRRHRSLRTLRF